MIKLIEDEKVVCKICNKEQKNLRGFSQHLKVHDINSKEYTFIYLLNSEIPKCKCGCGKDCLYFPFRFNEYRSGHNPDCFWQLKFDKNSEEYKAIIEKTSKTVSKYMRENPREITQEERDNHSKRMKETMSDEKEKKRRHDKMKETKRKQSEDGTLSERHWTKKLTEEELEIKLKEIGDKISEARRNNPKPAWNKGLTSETDERIDKWSGPNHYKFVINKRFDYSKLFKNKIYREFILDTQEGLCFGCGKVEEIERHSLHHIDENKQNHKFDNLIFVCRSCHTKIHNNLQYKDNFDLVVFEFKQSIIKNKIFVEFNDKYNFNI